ncbi:hypothetical protein [uncultured Corynebacterium sp.]|uniref:hypothetical protein n=1 Tax=uncultured Corynebacterium sp. TaxID=159447 RepID=UPI0025DAB01D|nr:hypothetical protein [uncultured Corynebacterium sp.]
MTGLRRRSLALSLAAATAFGGAVAAPAVADTVSSNAQGSDPSGSLPSVGSADLPNSSSPTDVRRSIDSSLATNCGAAGGDGAGITDHVKCGLAVVGGATVFFSVLALLRSVFYEITRL